MADGKSFANSHTKLQKALHKSQIYLESSDPKDSFTQMYEEDLKRQNTEPSTHVTPRKRICLKSNTSGLNLRAAYRRSVGLTNGRREEGSNVEKLKRASVFNKETSQMRNDDDNGDEHKDSMRTNLSVSPVIHLPSSEERKNEDFDVYFFCDNCNASSKDQRYCDRCRKPLPRHAKTFYKPKVHTKSSKETCTDGVGTEKFYSKKIQEQMYNNFSTTGTSSSTREQNPRYVRKITSQEPVCLTISSDEEEKSDFLNSDDAESTLLTNYSISTDYSRPLRTKRHLVETQVNSQSTDLAIELTCRSVRIGSFKYRMDTHVNITSQGFDISTVGTNDRDRNIKLRISVMDLVRVIYHLGPHLPTIFIYTTPGCAGNICSRLNMSPKKGVYYDPAGKDETQKRIILLMHRVHEEQRQFVGKIFDGFVNQTKNEKLFVEIDYQHANQLLVKSTPTQVQYLARLSIEQSHFMRQNHVSSKMMTYPPPPATGGITITSDDFNCLQEGEFLNDVIIDFYLKYLVQNKMSDYDRQRTHVFSSFFFRRLTLRTSRRNTSSEDSRLPASELRHSRVKTWTRHVNIFEKDFVIIPINEHSHWFLAVICFPYLDGPSTFCPEKKILKTNLSPMNRNDCESNEDKNLNTSQVTETAGLNETVDKKDEPIKQPCILIFDSLQSPNKGRIVSMLREYLRVEWLAKKKCPRSFDKNIMLGSSPKVPQQTNSSDCGIYLLQYVESFFEEPIQNYNIPIKSLKNWFTDEQVGTKRRNIQKLIYELMQEQQHGGETTLENSDGSTEQQRRPQIDS